MIQTELMPQLPPRTELVRALSTRDASYDGVVYSAVRTTGIFCRPSCPSRPKPENVEFFGSIRECVFSGYRPCKRCDPLGANGTAPEWVQNLLVSAEKSESGRLRADDLKALGVSPERARRWFKEHYGMSFTAWCRGQRLAGAFMRIRKGAPLDDVTFDSGFESHSGFREAFTKTFGAAPGRARNEGERLVTTMIESPVGPLLAASGDDGICLLEYTDRRMLEHNLAQMRRRHGCAVVPGDHPHLAQLKEELDAYFAGQLKKFRVPVKARGTPFQEKVWAALCEIPYGATWSYEQLATHIGQPEARRAVARANGMNRVSILIPCHRVIGKDGSLTGYGGGLWRKKLLLDLEQRTGHARGTHAAP